MESNQRRRRPKPRRRDKQPKSPEPETVASSYPIGGATTSTVHDIPDHVLEVILLRLDSHVSLVRAASACKRWCRLVADAGFLSRFHPLPPPPAPLILGHYYYHGSNYEQLVFAPSSTPSIRERSRQQSFSLDFVPKLDGGAWEIADSRDTLLLLSKSKHWRRRARSSSLSSENPHLVVCRPLTRRYQAISVPHRLVGGECLGFFLVGAGGGGIGLSNFKVVAVLLRDHMLVPGRGVPVACVYSRVSERRREWRDVSCTWSGGDIAIPNTAAAFCFAGRANGCLHWAILGARAAALVLDEATTGVSLVDLPVAINHPWYPRPRCFRVLDGGECGGAVSLRAVHLAVNELRVYARLRVGDEWVLQNLLPLPVPEDAGGGSPWHAMIVAAHETYVLVTPRDSVRVFSVDLKTMAVECVRQRIMYYEGPACPYELPWPPTLDLLDLEEAADNSSPQIQGHIDFQIPYTTKLKAKQNIGASLLYATALLSFFLSMVLLSFLFLA